MVVPYTCAIESTIPRYECLCVSDVVTPSMCGEICSWPTSFRTRDSSESRWPQWLPQATQRCVKSQILFNTVAFLPWRGEVPSGPPRRVHRHTDRALQESPRPGRTCAGKWAWQRKEAYGHSSMRLRPCQSPLGSCQTWISHLYRVPFSSNDWIPQWLGGSIVHKQS